MSIPAVLYDHVPADDLQYDSDIQNETAGESYFVWSMVHHRATAPREEDVDGDNSNGNKYSKQLLVERSRSIKIEEGSNENQRKYGINSDDDDENSEIIQNDESDDRPMETIIENIDFSYVLIPIPPLMMTNDHDDILPICSYTGKKSIKNKIRACGKALLRATIGSSESNCDRITNFSKANDTIAKCLSGCASGSRALVKPFQYYARELMPSSIYSSYDWVSETFIDGSGNRLILPGSCVALDSDDSRNIITDCDRNNSGDNHDAGMMIVHAGSNSVGLGRGIEASSSIPVASLSSSFSLWTSNTIMVSAHDLLAVKHDQRIQMGDRDGPRPLSSFDAIEEKGKSNHSRYYYGDDEYNMDHSTIMVATTQNVTQQWTRALWKLAQRKANMCYYMSRSCLRRSIQNAVRLFIYSQQLLIQYCKHKHNNRLSCRSLLLPFNDGFGNNEDHTCSIDRNGARGAEQESARSMILIVPPQKLSVRSFDDKQSSDENINEYDVTACSSEYKFVIEMATPMSKSRNNYPAL